MGQWSAMGFRLSALPFFDYDYLLGSATPSTPGQMHF